MKCREEIGFAGNFLQSHLMPTMRLLRNQGSWSHVTSGATAAPFQIPQPFAKRVQWTPCPRNIKEMGHIETAGQKHPGSSPAPSLSSPKGALEEFQRLFWVGEKLGSGELVVKSTNLHPSAEKGNVPHHRGPSRCFESNQKRHEQTRMLHLPSSSPLLPNKLVLVMWPFSKMIWICRSAAKHHPLWWQTQGKLGRWI